MSHEITHVIFDLDGTLIDSAPSILETFAEILDRHNLKPAVPINRSLIGPPLTATLRTLSGITDDALIQTLEDDFKETYDHHGLYTTKPYPGIDDLLQALHSAGKKLYIATNKRQRPTLRLIEHLGWTTLFEAIICTDSKTPKFPNKDAMLEALMKEQAINKNHSIYIGDTPADGHASDSNGIKFVAAIWGYGDWGTINQDRTWTTAKTTSDILAFA